MRVVLADSHDHVRSALRLLLEQEAHVEIVGEAAATAQMLQEVAGARPDLLLLDWELAGPDAAALVAGLRQRTPDLRIIALSGRSEVRKDAEAAGIDRFVSKSAFSEELLAALRGLAPESSDSSQPAPLGQPPALHDT
jgi:DNA-binding NarL/FixJ family response regulator